MRLASGWKLRKRDRRFVCYQRGRALFWINMEEVERMSRSGIDPDAFPNWYRAAINVWRGRRAATA